MAGDLDEMLDAVHAPHDGARRRGRGRGVTAQGRNPERSQSRSSAGEQPGSEGSGPCSICCAGRREHFAVARDRDGAPGRGVPAGLRPGRRPPGGSTWTSTSPVRPAERAAFRELVRRRADERVPVAQLVGAEGVLVAAAAVTPGRAGAAPGDRDAGGGGSGSDCPSARRRDPGARRGNRLGGRGPGAGPASGPKAQVTATDVSPVALEVARANADGLLDGWKRVRWSFAAGQPGSSRWPGSASTWWSRIRPTWPSRAGIGAAARAGPRAARGAFRRPDGLEVLRELVAGVGDVLVPPGEPSPSSSRPSRPARVADWCRAAGLARGDGLHATSRTAPGWSRPGTPAFGGVWGGRSRWIGSSSRGGTRLEGEVAVSGSKNATLALMAGALLADSETVLHNVPRLRDVDAMLELMRALGARAEWDDEDATPCASTPRHGVSAQEAPYDLVRKMRASFLVLGPLLARFGTARGVRTGRLRDRRAARGPAPEGPRSAGREGQLDHGYVEASQPVRSVAAPGSRSTSDRQRHPERDDGRDAGAMARR